MDLLGFDDVFQKSKMYHNQKISVVFCVFRFTSVFGRSTACRKNHNSLHLKSLFLHYSKNDIDIFVNDLKNFFFVHEIRSKMFSKNQISGADVYRVTARVGMFVFVQLFEGSLHDSQIRFALHCSLISSLACTDSLFPRYRLSSLKHVVRSVTISRATLFTFATSRCPLKRRSWSRSAQHECEWWLTRYVVMTHTHAHVFFQNCFISNRSVVTALTIASMHRQHFVYSRLLLRLGLAL